MEQEDTPPNSRATQAPMPIKDVYKRQEFVLTTHIDKDHVHNHLIFNAVSFADHKHYHSN